MQLQSTCMNVLNILKGCANQLKTFNNKYICFNKPTFRDIKSINK